MLSQKAWCRGNGSCNTRDAAAACSSASLGPDQAVGEAGAPSWRSALPGGFHLCARRLHSAAAPALLPAQLPTFAASGASIQVAAAQPAEDLLMLLSPWQAGAQALEAVHSASGLPWWASIPLTALAIRAALLPLSLKARAASAGLPLLDTALEQAGALPKQLAAEQSGAALGHTWGRLRLARFVHRYLRQQQRVPSMWWYAGNAAVQVRGPQGPYGRLITRQTMHAFSTEGQARPYTPARQCMPRLRHAPRPAIALIPVPMPGASRHRPALPAFPLTVPLRHSPLPPS